MMTTLVLVALFFAALLVGYFMGIDTAHPTREDAVELKRLLEQYETAVIAYYAEASPSSLDALKDARARLAWWRTHD